MADPSKGNHHNSHGHGPGHTHGHDAAAAGRLKFALILLSITLVAEVAGGLLSHSLALLADAGHVFMDLFAITVSLVAARLAQLPATSTKTYGWHRAEILAALINGALLVILSLFLFYEAWDRLRNPEAILSTPMLIVAAVGLVVNIVIALRLHGHRGRDLNLRSAYLHVLGDALASLGVIAAAIIIALTGWYRIDAIISIGIGLLIFAGAARLLFKAGHVLLEGVPSRISLEAVAKAVGELEGVKSVHDLHIWSVCSHIVSLSCHIHLEPKTPEYHDRMVRTVADMLWRRFSILHPTIQVDYETCGDEIVTQDMEHPKGA
jgi:cobalt-zinc-cadmium efflux system protein